jgi:CheY-like chemotaxis protein
VRIALLDDDPKRIEAMQKVLSGYDQGVVHFAGAPEMIAWLTEHLPSLRLLSLDHDLGPYEATPSSAPLPGNGQDVVDMLVHHKPTCPVIVHSSNEWAAAGMVVALRQAGWTVRRVIPTDDVLWIESSWANCVRLVLASQPKQPQ